MRKSMKCLSILGLLVGVLGAVTVSASAAEPQSGVYDLVHEAGYTVTAQKADGTAPVTKNIDVDGDGIEEAVSVGAEKFEVTYTGTDTGAFHLVLMLEGESKIPTADNIGYIDQTTDTTGSLKFTVYPSQMKNGTYKIYKSVSNGTGLEKIASFKYYQAYKLGDVDDDGSITATDSQFVLQMVVGMGNWSDTQRLSGDVDKDTKLTATDAQFILQRVVGMMDNFE